MKPLIVTAHLAQGYVASDRWSPSLDGILGWAMMRERHGCVAASEPVEPVEGLPLERIEHGGWWWYAASMPAAEVRERVRRYYHRRFDDHHALAFTDSSAKVLTTAGPYKSMRHNEMLALAPSVTWRCIGDLAEVERLLGLMRQIGRGVGRGYGQVTRWQIEEGGEAEAQAARFRRPLPVAYAEAHGLDGPRLTWGVRPPAWLPSNSALCVMPEVA